MLESHLDSSGDAFRCSHRKRQIPSCPTFSVRKKLEEGIGPSSRGGFV